MKFAIAYYLLLIYSTVILKPIIPVAEDALSHCFAEAYHIATVHAIYGNNHLEKQEADNSADNNNNNKNVLKEDNSTSVHISVIELSFNLNINNAETPNFIQFESLIQKIFLNIVLPPPKFLP